MSDDFWLGFGVATTAFLAYNAVFAFIFFIVILRDDKSSAKE